MGGWLHAASWGDIDLEWLQQDDWNLWFLHGFYRHVYGFLGWGNENLDYALSLIPDQAVDMGPLPLTGEQLELRVPLDLLGATDKRIEGIALLHPDGRVFWDKTAVVGVDGYTQTIWDNGFVPNSTALQATKIALQGLKQGDRIRVLFEDRMLVAEDGYFIDDFSGTDLYQFYGGGSGVGYGNQPISFHLYEIPLP